MIIKNIFEFINLKTLIITLLSVISTYLSIKFNLVADFPLNLIGIAIVFPIVFSIGEAYKRRETALEQYGIIKALGRALYFFSRDWPEKKSKEGDVQITEILTSLMINMRKFFKEKREGKEEVEIYTIFSKLSSFIEKTKKRGVTSSEISRANQYLSKIIIAFERMKHIYQYRTPVTLRLHSKIFIFLLPILYGPYFAFIAQDLSIGLTYIIPVFLTVVLVSLDNIQDKLENPFDNIGSDDVMINAEKFQYTLDDHHLN